MCNLLKIKTESCVMLLLRHSHLLMMMHSSEGREMELGEMPVMGIDLFTSPPLISASARLCLPGNGEAAGGGE